MGLSPASDAGSLRLCDADPDVAARLAAAVLATRTQSPAGIGKVFGWLGLTTMLAVGTSAILTIQQPGSVAGALLGSAIWLGGFAAVMASHRRSLRRAAENLSGADLRAAARLHDFSRAEAAYVGALASLADASPLLGESLTRDLLTQLNDLAANAPFLELQRAQLSSALGPTPLPELERERDALAARLETAPDEASRGAIAQSIALCDGRLKHAHALGPGLARIEAQEEVVYQTLASVESSLRQMRAAPAPPPAVRVEEIRRSTTEAVLQTRAVEEAVQKVLAVGGR